MVTVSNLCVELQKKLLLRDITCTLPAGRITVFMGKSGAGKTTLLKSLIGLVPAASGEICIGDAKLSELSPNQRAQVVGYVFQEFNLFEHMTVLGNCIDPLRVLGVSQEQAEMKAHKMLAQLGMAALSDVYPSSLSGGQQQRVAIARALCLNPSVLLLDEPSASLDPINTDILVEILRCLAAQGIAIGLSSQDMSFVRKIFDRAYYLDAGSISELCEGAENLAECPAITTFLGSK